MDRKGVQKIKYIFWISAVVLIVIIFFFFGAICDKKAREKQMQELAVIYPEIESELQDNFSFYQAYAFRLELAVMAATVFLIVLLACSLIIIKEREIKKSTAEYDKEYDLIYEQLLRFQMGNFELLPSMKVSKASGKLENIIDKLRSLSYYFSDLKLHLIEEENKTKSLITDISHQLKTPLASIRMFHEMAKSAELSEEEQKEYMEIVSQEIKSMEILLDELIKLSRLESNMIQINPKKNSIKQTISEAVSQIFMKAHEKNIEICVDMEKDIDIPHDRKWTVEAMANILENAVKYSEPKTAINVRVSYMPTSVLIEIEDEGIGIQEEELNNIFKRFFRGSKAKEMAKEGAGVGLYLARNIIEQQGGTIVAKRKSGCGSIFKITLPL